MSNPPKPMPPEGLRGDAREWWQAMVDSYDFDDDPAGLQILTSAAIQLQRAEQARAVICKEGVTTQDRFGYAKENPACVAERASLNVFRLLVRELALGPAADDDGRLPRLAGRYAS